MSDCTCFAAAGVTELDTLDRLVNVDGLNQVQAARLLWGAPEVEA